MCRYFFRIVLILVNTLANRLKQRRFLYLIWGGVTFGVSIISVSDSELLKMIISEGDLHLGEEDWLELFFAHVLQDIKSKFGITNEGEDKAQLRQEVNKAKNGLSTRLSYEISISKFISGKYK